MTAERPDSDDLDPNGYVRALRETCVASRPGG